MSILNQLRKYQKQPQEVVVDDTTLSALPAPPASPETEELPIPCGINSRWIGILYPQKMLTIYMHVLSGRYAGTSPEDACDDILWSFLKDRRSSEYVKTYASAATAKTKRLVMHRILVASFGLGDKDIDNLDSQYFLMACQYLGAEPNLSFDHAVRMIESAHAHSLIEEQIMGRIGYLLVWRDLCRPESILSQPALTNDHQA